MADDEYAIDDADDSSVPDEALDNLDADTEDADWPKRTPDRMSDIEQGIKDKGPKGTHRGQP